VLNLPGSFRVGLLYWLDENDPANDWCASGPSGILPSCTHRAGYRVGPPHRDVADGHIIPLLMGMHLAGAGEAEVSLAEHTLASIRVSRRRGRPRTRPARPVADRGYDSGPFRRALRRRGIQVCIPPKRRPATWKPKRGRPVTADPALYRERWRVERTFAWLGFRRRLLVRWERLLTVYQGFFTVALMLIAINRLLK
jgi:transposase